MPFLKAETSNENDISEGNYPVKEHEAAGNTSEHELPYGQKNEAFETKGAALFPRKDSLKRWSKPSTSGSTPDPGMRGGINFSCIIDKGRRVWLFNKFSCWVLL